MVNQEKFINEVTDLLKKRYGNRYQIANQQASASIDGLNPDSFPDIVIYDRASDKVMMVEVKGSSTSNDLPMATVQVIKKLQDVNSELNPKIVVVTPSNISSVVKSQLESQNVDLVKLDNLTDTFSRITKSWDEYVSNGDGKFKDK